jgi:hypothetical protein
MSLLLLLLLLLLLRRLGFDHVHVAHPSECYITDLTCYDMSRNRQHVTP